MPKMPGAVNQGTLGVLLHRISMLSTPERSLHRQPMQKAHLHRDPMQKMPGAYKLAQTGPRPHPWQDLLHRVYANISIGAYANRHRGSYLQGGGGPQNLYTGIHRYINRTHKAK